MQYDIIGDIHGHATKLENLLIKIGYTVKNGIYQQDDHQAVFVGDYIDRGEQNRRTLEIIRNMVEFGDARAVMGNHEYNAVCYHTLKAGSKTDYLRPHTHSKFRQHEAFLKEYPLGHEDTNDIIKWFKSLPLFIEFKHFRVVHACWDKAVIKHLRKKYLNKKNNSLKNQFWPESADYENKPPLFNYIEKILKGEEVSLPKGISFNDKDGKKRTSVRIKWWGDKSGMCRDVAFGYDHQTITNFPPVKPTIPEDSSVYPETAKPVFLGIIGRPAFPVSNRAISVALIIQQAEVEILFVIISEIQATQRTNSTKETCLLNNPYQIKSFPFLHFSGYKLDEMVCIRRFNS